MKKEIIVLGVAMLVASPSYAGFSIDYQGISKAAIEENKRSTPDGFSLLNGKYFGLIEEVGSGAPSITNSFGQDLSLSDAVGMIMPSNWFAYIDSNFESPPTVSWDANSDNWLTVLARMGKDNGLRYVVDWDQQLIQISKSKGFIKPDYNDPIIMEDKNSGRELYIYTSKEEVPGYLLVEGEYIPVSIVDK